MTPRKLSAVMLTLAVGATTGFGETVSDASQVPWPLKTLMSAPAWRETSEVIPRGDKGWKYAEVVNTPELRARDRASGNVTAILYEGLPYRGKPTRIFAWLGIPAHVPGEKLPGMVLVHGGGGTAYESWVRRWNALGYVAIAMDTVGNIPDQGRNRDGGPGNCGDFGETDQPIADQWAYHAVGAIILANSLLRSLPDVDPDRIGITGVSWGGFLTCLTAGRDHRFKCAISVYGCGHLADASDWIDRIKAQGEKGRQWCRLWDPAGYLPQVTVPFYWVAGTNDAAYWMDGLNKSYRQINGKRGLSIPGNMTHAHGGPGETQTEIAAIADYYLKNGSALPVFSSTAVRDNVLSVKYDYQGKTAGFVLYYATDEKITPKSKWLTMPVTDVSENEVRCKLPPGTTMAFINAIVENNRQFSSEIEKIRP